jgi:hypothetical protein
MFKLKNIEPATLNRIRLWAIIISFLSLCLIFSLMYLTDLKFFEGNAPGYAILVICVFLIVLFLFKRETVDKTIKRILFFLFFVSGIITLVFLLADRFLYDKLSNNVYWLLNDTFLATLITVCILFYLIYIHRIDLIIQGLIVVIIAGLILNRFGLEDEAIVLLILGFFFLVISIIYAGIRSLRDYKDNRFIGWVFFSLALILAFSITTILVKFGSWEAAHTSTLDFFGAVFFLVACLLLFAAMPFSNFIEWTKKQKQLFYRVFLIPMIFLLVLFSLKFLLPGISYQKLFFKGYTEMEKVYFGMDKYELEEIKEKENEED